ncbi:MAG: DNA primase, partial [Proteobacteria bacterium]|nr:DNA primase [Pseudomonadota bacterium]
MIEKLILSNLISNEEYGRKAIPFLKSEYFTERSIRAIYDGIDSFVKQYNKFPNKEALIVELDDDKEISSIYQDVLVLVNELSADDTTNIDWLIDQTEKFCQDKAIYNAIMKSIKILDSDQEKLGKGAIPQILSEALAVSFDSHIGHDFLEDFESRYDFYHKKEKRVPFDLDYLNKITKGGLPNKTLNVVLAGTGVGKSLFMCHCAASNLTNGLNVLYITLEMAEERIAERIDANLLNVSLDELTILPRDSYEKKISRVQEKTNGKLIIKEYPTASAGSGHMRHLLNELKLKRSFRPDIIYIDYLNICASSRLKYGANVNSYTYIKAIAEELRGLAVEFDVPIVTATQTTRSGFTSSDLGLEDTSESFGLPATADFMIALISSEELQDLNQIMVKQLKNRYNDPGTHRRFVVGVDRPKMKLYDVEQSAQEDIVDDGPAFDKSDTGIRIKSEKGKFKDA